MQGRQRKTGGRWTKQWKKRKVDEEDGVEQEGLEQEGVRQEVGEKVRKEQGEETGISGNRKRRMERWLENGMGCPGKTGGASGLFFPAVLDSRIPCCVSGVFCV